MNHDDHFDETHLDGGGMIEGDEDDGFSQTHIPNCSNDQSFSMAENPHPQNPLHLEMQNQCYNNSNCGFNGENQYQIYTTGSFPETPYPDLLLLPSSSNAIPQKLPPDLLASLGLMFDPVYVDPLNLASQPSSLLYHSFPNGDFAEINQNVDGISGEMDYKLNIGKDDVKHSASERQKRKDFNAKYKALKELIPNPTKDDRASIVGDTIEYINELKRTVSELKVLVEKRRRVKEMVKGEENVQSFDDLESSLVKSSWVHRKSKIAEVDVRIMDNDVTVKLIVQKRIINCLLFVGKAFDQLQLEIHNVCGGAIGDCYTYLVNAKICGGSNVYASAVANKVIQVLDQQYNSNQLFGMSKLKLVLD